MSDFLNKPYPFTTDLRYLLKLVFGISIGIFLFILFFEPLQLNSADAETYILTIAGFSGICFLLTCLLKIILPLAFRGSLRIETWDLKREIVLEFLIWSLNSVAFCFYLVYVGRVPLNMFLAFRIVLICLSIPVTILMINEINNQKNLLVELRYRNRELEAQQASNGSGKNEYLELASENRAEKLRIKPEDLILVRSAENYVEVLYRQDESLQKKLLRATMVNIEKQLEAFPEMVRCHRTCIVNTEKGVSLQRIPQGIRLRVPGYGESIPVSRQYLITVKTALERGRNAMNE